MDTKSQDKKVTLLHFIAHSVRVKFPDLLNFDSELRFIEKAAQGMAKFLLWFWLELTIV